LGRCGRKAGIGIKERTADLLQKNQKVACGGKKKVAKRILQLFLLY
jgi:hypothetical protein